MKRRKFSFLSVSAIMWIVLSSISCDFEESSLYSILRKPNSLKDLFSEDDIRIIGVNYLDKFPSENDDIFLVSLLLGNNNNKEIKIDLSAFLKGKIHRNFELQNIVVINGWILSKTEAMQCALLSKN